MKVNGNHPHSTKLITKRLPDRRSPLEALRRAVRRSSKTQAELCIKLGITEQHLSRFVTGKGGLSEKMAADLCRALRLYPVMMTDVEYAQWLTKESPPGPS